MIGAGEGFCKVGETYTEGDIKTGADACLEDGQGVEVSITGLQEEVFGVMVSSRRMGKCLREGGSGRIFRN